MSAETRPRITLTIKLSEGRMVVPTLRGAHGPLLNNTPKNCGLVRCDVWDQLLCLDGDIGVVYITIEFYNL